MGEVDEEGTHAAERGTAAVPAAPRAAEVSMPQPQPQTGPQTGAGSGGSRSSGSGGSDSGNDLLDTPPPAPCSRAEQNLLSPTPSPAAACPPAAAAACTACPDGPPPAGATAALPHAQAAGGRKGPLSPRATELRRQVMELLRLHSFVRCLGGSAVLPSALLIIEVTKQHPPVALGSSSPAGLEWTVSQMMALFLRTGDKAGKAAIQGRRRWQYVCLSMPMPTRSCRCIQLTWEAGAGTCIPIPAGHRQTEPLPPPCRLPQPTRCRCWLPCGF